jgi:NADPH:quinone reductase-like Zn-dependent oxidoreductase
MSAAASLPTVALTGIQLVETALGTKAGQKVLVTGALGGVGRAAVFALKKIGAHVVAGVRASQREEAAVLHADDVVALDDPKDLKRAGPFDAVADTIGGVVASSLLAYIRSGGELATTVPPAPQTAQDSGVSAKPINMKPNRPMLDRILRAAADGELLIPIARTFPLAEARKAHALGEKGVNGKILLAV